MAALKDYKITESEVSKRGMNVKEFLIDDSAAAAMEAAYQSLVTRIYNLNHEIATDDDILDALDTTAKVDAFKYAQYLVLRGLIYTDENPITQEVDAVIADRLKLKKLNGFQK